MVTASICTIGDEILIGQIIDTNSAKIASALNTAGVKVNRMISASDEEADITATLSACLKETDIVIVTGGLGPTKDDITKKTLAKMTGAAGYIQNEAQLKIIQKILSARGIELSDINLAQASVPDTCKVIVNECGTAPHMQFEIGPEKYGHKVLLFSLPGVPFEMEAALPKVIQAIREHFLLEHIFHQTICTFGIAESTLAKIIEEWEEHLPDNIHLAYLPNPLLGVRLRLSIYGVEEARGKEELEEQAQKLKAILKEAVYGVGEDSPQAALGRWLKKQQKTICTAESCTGGMIASLITSVPGSSGYFYGGIVSYDNSVKVNMLGVHKDTIAKYGAVSKECVEEMARGIREAMNTDYAIATSGIAGPGGGTKEKPVGTIWMAIAGKGFTIAKELHFRGDRTLNIERFSSNAIDFMRRRLSAVER